MAPEVLLGDKYDEKCDVFGYGAVLSGNFMLINQYPFSVKLRAPKICNMLICALYNTLIGIVSGRRPSKRSDAGLNPYAFRIDQSAIPPECNISQLSPCFSKEYLAPIRTVLC